MAAPYRHLLRGSLAIVTGAANGIGRATCRILAREGAHIAAVDIDTAGLVVTCDSLGKGEYQMFLADISQADQVQELVANVYQHFDGAPSVLVNCAGITRDCFMADMSERHFDEVLNVNLKGTFLMMKAVSAIMIENQINPAAIVNISSITGKVGNMGQVNYAASKSGIIGLTKSGARELAKHGIRCNCILPGFIETAMTRSVPDKLMETILKLIPMRRQGYAEEVAETVLFLASQKSSYITGNSIEVAGGLHM